MPDGELEKENAHLRALVATLVERLEKMNSGLAEAGEEALRAIEEHEAILAKVAALNDKLMVDCKNLSDEARQVYLAYVAAVRANAAKNALPSA
jgi:hypothetical protein